MKINSECLRNPEQEARLTFTAGKEREGYYKILKLDLRDGRMQDQTCGSAFCFSLD